MRNKKCSIVRRAALAIFQRASAMRPLPVAGLGKHNWGRSAYALLLLFVATPIALSAQITPLHTFLNTDGQYPYAGLVQGTSGDFYGTTQQGGTEEEGTVFKITPGGTLTTLHSFDGPDGELPYAGLVQATNGDFYGTTYYGGPNDGSGTFFKITPGGTLITLYSFCALSGCADGAHPQATLVQATNGDFYGTTSSGGINNDGTVFKITGGGMLTTLHNFDGTDGEDPYGALVQATNGDFYGTTSSGGANGDGTVFKMTASGSLTTLHSFDNTDGSTGVPAGPLEGASYRQAQPPARFG